MRHRARLAILLAALAAITLWAADRPAIAPEELSKHVHFLAAPELKGRGTGTPENDRAAQYIADHFRKLGLEPALGKSFFQKFPVTVGAELGKENRAAASFASETEAINQLKVGENYIPLNFSDSGEVRAPVVFAGYGITSGEHRYDDYAHLDAKDKAVVVLRHEPQEDDEKSVFAGRALTQHSQIVNKAINARNHGARVMILVNDPLPHPNEPDELVRFGSLTGPENAGLLLIHAKRAVVERWLKPSGKTLAELQRAIDERLEPQSFGLAGTTLTLRVDVKRLTAETQNVVAVLRGRDPKLSAEAVMLGAHFDHLGLGERNSLAPSLAGQVHPGADDNASGTAALLELARALAGRHRDLRRSVVFAAFSGEELGLLGSAHYTKSPPWPLERTAAMINLDMVGRPRDAKVFVGGMKTSPVFEEVVKRANRTGLAIEVSEGGGYGSSDHQSFYVKEVPVLFFFSGLHADYHKPSDTPDRIQYDDLARVADLALQTTLTLAALDERPAYVRVEQPRPAGTGGGPGYGAYFGSIPDMGEQVEGVKFADVRDASPAAQAGLRAGDVLVEFAGKPIKNLYDFTYALRAHRPGEEVEVTVLRGQQRLTVKVTLAQRR